MSFTCSGSSMSIIPDAIPLQTVNLDLSGNRFKAINRNDFQGCSNVVLLDLSYNVYFEIIDSVAFRSLTSLTTLKLINSLRDPKILYASLFHNLANLRSLAIQNNFVMEEVEFSLEIFSKVLKSFPTWLESLEVDTPSDVNFVSKLSGFRFLNHLGLYFKKSFQLQITNETFKSISILPIEKLRIQSDNFTTVEPLAFAWFPRIQQLDLSYSNGMSVADVYPAWYGLQNSTIRVINLESFGKKYKNSYIHLNSTFF